MPLHHLELHGQCTWQRPKNVDQNCTLAYVNACQVVKSCGIALVDGDLAHRVSRLDHFAKREKPFGGQWLNN
jgi:hypothetical protein